MQRTLYSYWRSSAAYRLRIALNLKLLNFEQKPVDLVANEQKAEDYLELNPAGLVPALVVGTPGPDQIVLGQSLAMIEYLEEVHPEPALLPVDPVERARVRQIALIVACEMHPLNNIAILRYLKDPLGVSDEAKQAWYEHWVERGFDGIERILGDGQAGNYCHGDQPTYADVFLVPQVYNARRFNCDLEPYPQIRRAEANCLEHPAFANAIPEKQPDAR
ncbi:MAG: maleylacetoacetate isomerase [Proteobacteria bacterium]|nr:MAG: maleylacetoacetate isomerase [Pseudomonadota bacterium]